jgi:hypothetical protein
MMQRQNNQLMQSYSNYQFPQEPITPNDRFDQESNFELFRPS